MARLIIEVSGTNFGNLLQRKLSELRRLENLGKGGMLHGLFQPAMN